MKDIDSLTDTSCSSMDLLMDSEDVDAMIARSWQMDRLPAIVKRWKLSETEQNHLLELRIRLKDIRHEKNDPEEVVRFVREAGSLRGAERMFRRFIDFRLQQVDGILHDYKPDPVLKSHFPMTLLDGCDKDGDGVWLERIGATDAYGLYERFGRAELMRYCLWARESASHTPWRQKYEAEKKQAPRVIAVVDLQGLNRNHMRPALLPIFADMVQVVQNYYCGFIKKIIIIREPPIFKVIWNIVKHFFNANMKELMVFSGSNYVNVLEEYIDDLEAILPPCLLEGGRGTVAEGMPQRLDGGPLPPHKQETTETVSFFKDLELSRTASSLSSDDDDDDDFEPRLVGRDPSTKLYSGPSPRRRQQRLAVKLNTITDHESMSVRCRLVAKGSF